MVTSFLSLENGCVEKVSYHFYFFNDWNGQKINVVVFMFLIFLTIEMVKR